MHVRKYIVFIASLAVVGLANAEDSIQDLDHYFENLLGHKVTATVDNIPSLTSEVKAKYKDDVNFSMSDFDAMMARVNHGLGFRERRRLVKRQGNYYTCSACLCTKEREKALKDKAAKGETIPGAQSTAAVPAAGAAAAVNAPANFQSVTPGATNLQTTTPGVASFQSVTPGTTNLQTGTPGVASFESATPGAGNFQSTTSTTGVANQQVSAVANEQNLLNTAQQSASQLVTPDIYAGSTVTNVPTNTGTTVSPQFIQPNVPNPVATGPSSIVARDLHATERKLRKRIFTFIAEAVGSVLLADTVEGQFKKLGITLGKCGNVCSSKQADLIKKDGKQDYCSAGGQFGGQFATP